MQVKVNKLNVFEVSADNEYSAFLRFRQSKLKNGKTFLELDVENSYLYDSTENTVAFLRAVANAIEAK